MVWHTGKHSFLVGLIGLFFVFEAQAIGPIVREHLTIVGSSTLYPMITIAAERYGQYESKFSPTVESTGTGGGFKLLCNGEGLETPDINMASRAMKLSEWNRCVANKITELRVLKVGRDGIVLANSKQGPSFSLRALDLYLALAQEVPDPDGGRELIPNPYRNWREINASLPDVNIRVFGPPPTSGTRDLLVEQLFKPICLQFDLLRAMQSEDQSLFEHHCYALREDNTFIPAGENDSQLVRRLMNDPGAVGILGYNQLQRHQDRVQSVAVDGIKPSHETISDGSYLLTRRLFLYAKQGASHKARGVDEFLKYLSQSQVSGAEGYLADFGLVPLSADERELRRNHSGSEAGCLLNGCPCELPAEGFCCQACQ